MCGICGFYSKREESLDNLAEMAETIKHRGPDDHGEEIYGLSSGYVVGFAQRRLAVIDLSPSGHQPMHSVNKRISVVFNGEIYNYQELKRELGDYTFQSNSDTEVIIASYLKWGIRFLDKVNGMYAIAIFDRADDTLYLVRDRIGKKPLYYYISEGNLYFGSELKPLMKNRFFVKEIHTEIVGRFLHKRYIAAPDSIFKNVYKLEQGTVLQFREGVQKKWKYWDVTESYHKFRKEGAGIGFAEAKNELKKRLVEAVRRRLAADVPIGAFLSGGYDSSLVCAIAQGVLDTPLRTYCIGFEDAKINEAPYAKQVAEYLGTKHTELYITDNEMLELVQDIPLYYDEPFADVSQIPSMLVADLAKKDVTVVLSGDGGDEFFSGYHIYTMLQKAQALDKAGAVLYFLRKFPILGDGFADGKGLGLPYRIVSDVRNKDIQTQAGVNSYVNLIRGMLLDEGKSCYYPDESKYHVKRWDIRRMLLDMETYLPEDILCKVDRASMKYALECRCPILDKEVMEYSYMIPQCYKNEKGNQKQILKSMAYDYIPQKLLDRPKAGFGIPLDAWMRKTLKQQILEYADGDFLKRQGIFHVENTQKVIVDYLETGDMGKWSGANYSKIVWPYFIFQQWYTMQERCQRGNYDGYCQI